jgi:hypothetical protein
MLVPRLEGSPIEDLAAHEDAAPLAVPPELHFGDRTARAKGRKPCESRSEAVGSKRPVGAAEHPIKMRSTAPDSAQAEPGAAAASPVEHDEAEAVGHSAPI